MTNWAADHLAANPSLAARPFERVRHGFVFDMGLGNFQLDAAQRPVHYEILPGIWSSIDTALIDDGTYLHGLGTPVRIKKSDGAVEFLKTHHGVSQGVKSQRASRVVRYRPSNGNISNLADVPTTGTVNGDSWSRTWGDLTYTVRLTEDGVQQTLVMAAEPSLPGAQATDYVMVEEHIPDSTLPDGWLDAAYVQDGFLHPLPRAWDANGPLPVRRLVRSDAQGKWILTGVLVSDIQGAAYPVTIDPDYSGSTADGSVAGYDQGEPASYSTARNTYTTWTSTSTLMSIGQNYVFYDPDEYFECMRGALKFDTSAIGSASTVHDARLGLTVTNDQSTTNFQIWPVKYNWSASDPLGAGNAETVYDGILAATREANLWLDFGVTTLGYAINTLFFNTSGSLDTSWINKTGPTYYGLQSNRDYNGTQPSNSEFCQLATADHATSGYRPVLRVQFSKLTSTLKQFKLNGDWTAPSDSGDSLTAFTPAANSLLVVLCGLVDNNQAATASTITISGGSLTWNRIIFDDADTTFDAQVVGWYAVVGGSPVSTTVQLSWTSGKVGSWSIACWEFAAGTFDSGTPIGGKVALASQGADVAPLTATLDAAPTVNDVTLSLLHVDGGTSGTYWAEEDRPDFSKLADTYSTNSNIAAHAALQMRTQSTSTAAGWDDTKKGTGTTYTSAVISIVVKAASTAPSGTGAPRLPRLSAAGTATNPQTAAGAPKLPKLIATGAATETFSASGVPRLPRLAATGAATETFSATGASSLPKLIAAGVAAETFSAAGASSLPKLIAAGAATETFSATGASSLPHLVAAGTATAGGETPSAAGASSLPHLVSTSSSFVGQIHRPSGTSAAGNWTAQGGATLHGVTSDSAESSWAQLLEADDPSAMTVTLPTVDAPGAGDGAVLIRWRRT